MKKTQTLAVLGACLIAVSAFGNSIYELGTVIPGEPASEADELVFLTSLINSYNTGTPASPFDILVGPHTLVGTVVPGTYLPSPGNLPAPGADLGNADLQNGPQTELTLSLGAGGYSYALIKWGRSSELYYIGGLTGDVVLSNDINDNGASHWDLWGPGQQVPDGGTTVLLLGVALSGLGLIRRKLS